MRYRDRAALLVFVFVVFLCGVIHQLHDWGNKGGVIARTEDRSTGGACFKEQIAKLPNLILGSRETVVVGNSSSDKYSLTAICNGTNRNLGCGYKEEELRSGGETD